MFFSFCSYKTNINRYSKLEYGLSLQFFYPFLTSEKLVIFFSKSKLLMKNSISNNGLMKRAARKTIVVIYRVMYTEHDEYTLGSEAIECSDNESLE